MKRRETDSNRASRISGERRFGALLWTKEAG